MIHMNMKAFRQPVWLLFFGLLMLGAVFGLPKTIQARPYLDTIINENISSDTTWTLAGSPYIINTGLDILNGATLTIEAGVQVRFNEATWLDVNNGAGLQVNGTTQDPVVFTSNLAEPNPGDWYSIDVEAGGTAAIDRCEIAYGGRLSNDALGIFSTVTVAVSNCDIHHNQDEGVQVGGGGGVKPSFSNVTIRDNGDGAVQQGVNTEPTYHNVTLNGNGDDGIYLAGDYTVPVVLDGSGLNGENFVALSGINILAGGGLTFTAGTTLTFASATYLDVENGGMLNVNGTAEDPVVFTSNAATPNPGDWYYINVYDGGMAAIDHCEIAYAGRIGTDALRIYTKESVSVSNCDIHHNQDEGVLVSGGAGVKPSFNNVTLHDNVGGAVQQDANTEPTYHNVTLIGNGDDGIYLAGDYTVPVVLDGSGLNGENFVALSGINILAGGGLTFTAGTTLTFASATYLDVENGGRLNVKGTAEAPVVFTSNGASPVPGDWYSINVKAGSAAAIDHCEIAYGGRLDNDALQLSSADSVAISNCDIHHNQDEGVLVSGGAGVKPSFSSVTIRNNGGGAIQQDSNTEPTYSDVTMTGNGDDGIYLTGDYTVPVILDGSGLNGGKFVATTGIDIFAGGGLTFTAGTTLTFGIGLGLDVESGGKLQVSGTVTNPVVFTSNAAAPVPGDWYNINVYAGGEADFNHCELAYAGRLGNDALRIFTAGPVAIHNCDIHDNQGRGVAFYSSSSGQIVNSLIHHNDGAAVAVSSGSTLSATNNTLAANSLGLHADVATVSLVNNLISHNTDAGLRSTDGAMVDLLYNNLYNPDGVNYEGLADQTGINGNISGDPRYVDLDGGNISLGSGSAAIDAATSDGAPLTDFLGNPRYDDPAVADIGGGNLTYYDIGALERQLPSNPVNLLLESAGVDKSEVTIGESVTISWTVRNNQSDPAEGEWVDAVFASSDKVWDIDDTVVGEVTHSGGLDPDATYNGQVTFTNPPNIAGDLVFILRSDARQGLRETIESDNEITVTVQLTVPQLLVDQPLQNAFGSSGEVHYYQIKAPAYRTLSVTVDSQTASGSLALFLRDNAIPDPNHYDARSPAANQPDQQVILPATGEEPLYLMVKAESGPAASSPYTLTAGLPGFKIRQISPAVAGNSGSVTLEIESANLTRWSQVQLIDLSFAVLEPEVIYFGDQTRLFATFDLTGVLTGTYDVRLFSEQLSYEFDPGTEELVPIVIVDGDHTLIDGLAVSAEPQPGLVTRLMLPGAARLGRVFPFQVEIFNDSYVDQPSPVVLVRSPNGTPVSLSQQVGPNDPSEIQLLVLSQSGQPTALKPGERIVIQLYGYASKVPGSQFTVQDLRAPGAALDWAPFELVYKDDTSDEDWDITWANFLGIVGGTWDRYHEALRLAAAEQSFETRGTFVSVEQLTDNLLERASLGQNDLSGFLPYPTGMDDPFDIVVEGPGSTIPEAAAPEQLTMPDDAVRRVIRSAEPSPDYCDDYRPRSEIVLGANEIWADTILANGLSLRQSSRTGTLYSEYATFGQPQYKVFAESDEIVQGNLRAAGFRNSQDTMRVVDSIVKKAIRTFIERLDANHPSSYRPEMFPPNVAVPIDVKILVPKGAFDTTQHIPGTTNYAHHLEWNLGLREIPGALAGGVGETPTAGKYSKGSDIYGDDERAISGSILFTRRVNLEGKTIFFNVQSDLRIYVKDTLDFCPGNLGGGATWLALTPLAELEANNRAHDIGFSTTFRPADPSAYIIPPTKIPDNFDPDDRPSPSCDDAGVGTVLSGIAVNTAAEPQCSDDTNDVRSFFSSDPNEIVGPAGVGDGGWITPEEPLPYIIRFENDPGVATAPAQEVFITNQLDPDMDWSTFELLSMGFGSFAVEVSPGQQSFEAKVDWSNQDGSPLLVEIKAGLNQDTGLVSWSFRSLDPDTGLLPFDPLAGFLPVNDKDLHNGEGFVTYLIRQKADLASGTTITNQAEIVFDINEPILTNVVLNSIDTTAPDSTVSPLPPTSPESFTVSWSGDDGGESGIAFFDIYVSDDGDPFIAWQTAVTVTEAVFSGEAGHTYSFYSVATDLVGRRQPTPAAAQASTLIVPEAEGEKVYLPMIVK